MISMTMKRIQGKGCPRHFFLPQKQAKGGGLRDTSQSNSYLELANSWSQGFSRKREMGDNRPKLKQADTNTGYNSRWANVVQVAQRACAVSILEGFQTLVRSPN